MHDHEYCHFLFTIRILPPRKSLRYWAAVEILWKLDERGALSKHVYETSSGETYRFSDHRRVDPTHGFDFPGFVSNAPDFAVCLYI